MPPEAPKRPKPLPMTKIPIGIYHDEAPPHKFRNKPTKTKIGRLVFLSSKPNRQGTAAPSLAGEFREIAAENQVIFSEPFDNIAKRFKAHENLVAEHAIKIKDQEEAYQAMLIKWANKRRLWEWETAVSLYRCDKKVGATI